MSRVSYFQRFSQRENHATNNTLLVLRYLYQAAPFKLEQVLGGILETTPTIGLTFDQQVKGIHSVPDALISQKPLRMFIETKLGDGLWRDQIERHIASITANPAEQGGETYLIGLTKTPISEAEKDSHAEYAKARGVQFRATTFTEIATLLRAACADYEPTLIAIVEDYRSFLENEGLLDDRQPDGWRFSRAARRIRTTSGWVCITNRPSAHRRIAAGSSASTPARPSR